MKFIAALLLAFCISTAAAASKRKVIIDQDAFGPAGSNLQATLLLRASSA
jgi:hypothetical protein